MCRARMPKPNPPKLLGCAEASLRYSEEAAARGCQDPIAQDPFLHPTSQKSILQGVLVSPDKVPRFCPESFRSPHSPPPGPGGAGRRHHPRGVAGRHGPPENLGTPEARGVPMTRRVRHTGLSLLLHFPDVTGCAKLGGRGQDSSRIVFHLRSFLFLLPPFPLHLLSFLLSPFIISSPLFFLLLLLFLLSAPPPSFSNK